MTAAKKRAAKSRGGKGPVAKRPANRQYPYGFGKAEFLAAAKALAEQEQVDVRTYRVIYKVTEDVRAALVGMLKPESVEHVTGTVEARSRSGAGISLNSDLHANR